MPHAIRIFLVLLMFMLAGCAHVPLSVEPNQSPLPYMTDELQTYESLHFKVRSRNYERILEISRYLEEIYQRIMYDTNLLSFKPKENYTVTIYRDRDEYSNKTGYPYWSGGGTLTETLGQILPSEKETKARTSIATYDSAAYPPLLAHEITHLVFNEFMEFKTVEEAVRVAWLNEGLATFEEINARDENGKDQFVKKTNPILMRSAYPFREMIHFRPANRTSKMIGMVQENGKQKIYTNIDLWYWQVRSVVEFLITRHGSYNFFLLLNSVKNGTDVPDAFEATYPGKWRNMDDLENEWRESLKNF